MHSLAVHRQVVVVVVLLVLREERVPFVPARSDGRPVTVGVITVQELADVRGHVPGPVQPHGQHVALVAQGHVGVAEHSVVVPILAG